MQTLRLSKSNYAIWACAVAALVGGTALGGEPAKKAPDKKPYLFMDYGSFIAQSFQNTPGGKFDAGTGHWANTDVTPRGVAVRLETNPNQPDAGLNWESGVIFDTAVMRISSVWTTGGIALKGTAYDEGHGPSSHPAKPILFTSPNAPGWASPDGSFHDPRKNNLAPLPPGDPLPKNWSHFKGMYRNGNTVVFSYTVGGANVLETSALEKAGEQKVYVRTINVQKGFNNMQVVLCAAQDAKIDGLTAAAGALNIGVSNAPADAKLEAANGQLVLKFNGSADSTFKVHIADGGEAAKAAFGESVKSSPKPVDVAALTKGGPAQWTAEITTKGTVAEDKQAYVVDTLTLPNDNPYKSYMRVGAFDFFADGTRAALSTWSGDVWIVSGIDEKLESLKWKRFATGIHHPLGLKIVDEKIYTVGNSQITRLHDLNNDGEADFYENFNNDWQTTTAFHAFCFDLLLDPQGNFVFAMGAPVRNGGRSFQKIADNHGTITKVAKDGSKSWVYASGLRAPNGIGVHPETGQVTSGDNEGTFVPRSPINWIKENSYNGVVDTAHEFGKNLKTTSTLAAGEKVLDQADAPKPLAWLSWGAVDNSGGGQTWVTSDKWGPFKGDMLHLSYGKSSLYKVLYEEVNGQVQGGVTKFPVSFTSSAMRGRFNTKDGQLYVCGLRGWQTNAGQPGGFNRVRYTGKPAHMPKTLKVKKYEIEIGFTDTLDAAIANDAQNYVIEVWNYKWTHNYGSEEFSVSDPNKKISGGKGYDSLNIKSAKLGQDGKTLKLEVEGLQPVMQMRIQGKLKGADGADVKLEIYNTIHNLGE